MLNFNKAARTDAVHAKFLKAVAHVLAYPLYRTKKLLVVKLFVFVEECKIVKLKPLFKKGCKSDSKN